MKKILSTIALLLCFGVANADHTLAVLYPQSKGKLYVLVDFEGANIFFNDTGYMFFINNSQTESFYVMYTMHESYAQNKPLAGVTSVVFRTDYKQAVYFNRSGYLPDSTEYIRNENDKLLFQDITIMSTATGDLYQCDMNAQVVADVRTFEPKYRILASCFVMTQSGDYYQVDVNGNRLK